MTLQAGFIGCLSMPRDIEAIDFPCGGNAYRAQSRRIESSASEVRQAIGIS